jgi:hypothetical protein
MNAAFAMPSGLTLHDVNKPYVSYFRVVGYANSKIINTAFVITRWPPSKMLYFTSPCSTSSCLISDCHCDARIEIIGSACVFVPILETLPGQHSVLSSRHCSVICCKSCAKDAGNTHVFSPAAMTSLLFDCLD